MIKAESMNKANGGSSDENKGREEKIARSNCFQYKVDAPIIISTISVGRIENPM